MPKGYAIAIDKNGKQYAAPIPGTDKIGGLSANQKSLEPGQGGTNSKGMPFTIDEAGTPVLNVQPVPGFVPVAGSAPNADDAKKLKTAVTSRNNLIPMIAKYKKLVKKYGSEMGGAGDVQLNNLRSQIVVELKNISELGALSGPDQGILDAQLYDPTSFAANARDSSPLRFWSSATDLTNLSLENLKENIDNRVKAASQSIGFKPVTELPGWGITQK
jgi:hypothetical protein